MDQNQNHGTLEKILTAGNRVLFIIKEKIAELQKNPAISLKKIAAGALVLAVFSTTAGVYKTVQGYRVFFNGTEVGMVRQREDFMQGLELIQQGLSNEYGMDVVFQNEITFERAFLDKDVLLETPAESAQAIRETSMDLTVEGAMIVIEGEDVVALSSREEAEKTLESVIASFAQLGDNEVIVSDPVIQQNYEIVDRLVPFTAVRNMADAATYIMQGTDEIVEYQVQKGDTSWNIAVNRGININTLASANPDKNIENLHPGDVLKLTEEKPYLNVEVVKQSIYSEKIPFGTTYQNDGNLYVGKTQEISAGVYGVKEVTALITYQNGVQVAKQITSENVIKQPVNQVMAKGTKPLPPAQGTGRFRMPTSGRVSVINKAGAHAGGRAVDIANSTGTPIYASDSGRVTKASWYSGYGYAVIIDHGNGYSTLYGHLSSMSVSVGQNVTAGQRIASMGSTGNSTGSHLHFEIRINGARQVITRYFTNLRVGGYVSP